MYIMEIDKEKRSMEYKVYQVTLTDADVDKVNAEG